MKEKPELLKTVVRTAVEVVGLGLIAVASAEEKRSRSRAIKLAAAGAVLAAAPFAASRLAAFGYEALQSIADSPY